MIETQEEARSKLARDLHDGPTQSVAAIAMRVNYARRLLEKDPKATAAELYSVEEQARQTTMEIRHMLFTLRPLVLESQGLDAALQSMADKMRQTYNQEVIVSIDSDTASQLEPSKQGVVFNIIEEAVNNARKHARAGHIWVRLQPTGKEIALLEIKDDGVGFDLDLVNAGYDSRGSLGMVNMRERTELLTGYLKINSKPGKGTQIAIYIPLTEAAVERARQNELMPANLRTHRILRLGGILLGVVAMLWLSFEGRDERQAILLAALLSSLGAIATGLRFGGRLRGYWYLLLGAAFGTLVPLLAVLLMVVKIGLHGHSVPDFTLAQISAVLRLIPVWGGVGLLVGGAAALYNRSRG